MKISIFTTLVACSLLIAGQAAAQSVSPTPVPCNGSSGIGAGGVGTSGVAGGFCGSDSGYSSSFTGPVTAQCVGVHGYGDPLARGYFAARDHFSPRPHYAYSKAGIDATRVNQWNIDQAVQNPWHCNYSYWRWGVPTALVVPPTAAFQSEYNWGVAQTKSLPIYHQFGREYVGGAGDPSQFAPKPYWPSGTYQYGVYPVRAPH